MVERFYIFNTKTTIFETEIEIFKKMISKTTIFKYNYYFSQSL